MLNVQCGTYNPEKHFPVLYARQYYVWRHLESMQMERKTS